MRSGASQNSNPPTAGTPSPTQVPRLLHSQLKLHGLHCPRGKPQMFPLLLLRLRGGDVLDGGIRQLPCLQQVWQHSLHRHGTDDPDPEEQAGDLEEAVLVRHTRLAEQGDILGECGEPLPESTVEIHQRQHPDEAERECGENQLPPHEVLREVQVHQPLH